jgi:hypothetical protein
MLVMRWDGASWRLVPAPNHLAAPIALSDVAAISASDVWAVGAFMRELGPGVSVERAAALHWDGQRWAEVFVPSPPTSQRMAIRSIAAIATNDIWAVGDYGDGSDRAIALHWDGARWSLVAAPSVMAENRFTHLAANVQGTVWAVGSSDNREDGPNYALAAHFGPCPPAAAP